MGFLSYKTDYAGHPFENRPVGHADHRIAIRAEELSAHLAKLREPRTATVW